ncbi:MAG: carboxypeptidase-like regulatory domain-containing protein [Bacteroidales bacterium]|nr:carboxypeptidase-like regulatory domain-containing protein [Bacteroidales bacterium]MDD4685374.1 carboxypeptidase-like regulatory domain-containing protein [Bacteroidales bacterium]
MKTKQILLTLLLFIPFFCYSQTVTIKGNVVAVADGLPVDNVNILIKGTNIGISSDKDGMFVLNNVKLPAILKVSHLAFFSQDIALTKADVNKRNTINLNIQLSDRATNLSEVTIEDKPNNRIERLVYDFEVDDSNLYVIRNKKDNKQLHVYSFEDYLKKTQKIPRKCNVLGVDEMKNVYVKQESNADYWIVNSNPYDTSLVYQELDSLNKSIVYVLRDAISDQSNYVLTKTDFDYDHTYWIKRSPIWLIGMFNNSIYCFIYTLDMKGMNVYRVFLQKDKLKYTFVYLALYDVDDWLRSNVMGMNYNVIKNINVNIKLFAQIENIKQSRKIIEETHDKRRSRELYFLYKSTPFELPVFPKKIGDYLYIFNFEKDIIYKLDGDNYLIAKIKMDTLKENPHHIEQVIINRENTYFYIKDNFNDRTYLKEFNLNTGKYIKTITLPQNRIEKIRIVGNYIYYTASVEGANALERQLFKIKLEK